MPETERQSSSSQPAGDGAQSTEVTRQGGEPLSSDRGKTSIADSVVTKIAGIAVREVAGVHALGGGASRAVGSVTHRVGIGDSRTQGVSLEVGERQAAADVKVVIDYGESIPRVAGEIRDNVVRRVEAMTGLTVTEVNVEVNDMHFPGEEQDDSESPRVQ